MPPPPGDDARAGRGLRWVAALWALAAAALWLLADAALAQPPAGALHEAGRKVYNYRCYFCHGYSGDARTVAAAALNPKPRDFTQANAQALPLARITQAVREGRPGTAMKPFAQVLSAAEIEAVSAFVAEEFVRNKAANTAYHTPENGWPKHQRHAAAFPFVSGQLSPDTPAEQLDATQRRGRELFLTACVTCHEAARSADEPVWSSRPVSYPRMGFVPGQPNTPPVDAVSSASVYAKHEVKPVLQGLTAQQRRGEALFQANCAFCHGGDGSGKNWIGQFMEPKARNLTAYTAETLPRERLRQVIRDGLPGTSMPAWRQVLSPAQVDAVAAYVLRAFVGHPVAGDSR